MEGRMCKICNKVFSNGRALGGHMRSHLLTLPLPIPSKKPIQLQLTTSPPSHHHSDTETGRLRENPKRSFRMADHGGSTFVVEEDRESETRKTKPTRKRSKRARVTRCLVKEPSMSSDAEEEVALCLMMLSRDVWSFIHSSKYQCETCDKVFDSFQALGGHKTSHRNDFTKNAAHGKLHECPFCYRVFGSGQALGGHKRSHVLGSSTATATATSDSLGGSVNLVNSTKGQGNLVILDLNLPAPTEDEETSAVSDAEFCRSPFHL